MQFILCSFSRKLYWTRFVLPSFNPPSCHSARRACPELQNPLSLLAKNNLLPREKVPLRTDEGCEKVIFPGPLPPSAAALPLPKGEGYFFNDGFCDFAIRLRAEWQGGVLWKVKVFGIDNPTERKSFAMGIDFLMMLCVLVRIVAMCIDYGLMLIGFDWSMFLTKNICSSFYAVLAAKFTEPDSCYNLPTLPYVILHEGLARSCRIHCFS